MAGTEGVTVFEGISSRGIVRPVLVPRAFGDTERDSRAETDHASMSMGIVGTAATAAAACSGGGTEE